MNCDVYELCIVYVIMPEVLQSHSLKSEYLADGTKFCNLKDYPCCKQVIINTGKLQQTDFLMITLACKRTNICVYEKYLLAFHILTLRSYKICIIY